MNREDPPAAHTPEEGPTDNQLPPPASTSPTQPSTTTTTTGNTTRTFVQPTRSGSREILRGRCLWFDHKKGFGFITLDNQDNNVFVHHTEILARGFRSLEPNEPVEFSLEVDEKGRVKAVNVTAINGGYVRGGNPPTHHHHQPPPHHPHHHPIPPTTVPPMSPTTGYAAFVPSPPLPWRQQHPQQHHQQQQQAQPPAPAFVMLLPPTVLEQHQHHQPYPVYFQASVYPSPYMYPHPPHHHSPPFAPAMEPAGYFAPTSPPFPHHPHSRIPYQLPPPHQQQLHQHGQFHPAHSYPQMNYSNTDSSDGVDNEADNEANGTVIVNSNNATNINSNTESSTNNSSSSNNNNNSKLHDNDEDTDEDSVARVASLRISSPVQPKAAPPSSLTVLATATTVTTTETVMTGSKTTSVPKPMRAQSNQTSPQVVRTRTTTPRS